MLTSSTPQHRQTADVAIARATRGSSARVRLAVFPVARQRNVTSATTTSLFSATTTSLFSLKSILVLLFRTRSSLAPPGFASPHQKSIQCLARLCRRPWPTLDDLTLQCGIGPAEIAFCPRPQQKLGNVALRLIVHRRGLHRRGARWCDLALVRELPARQGVAATILTACDFRAFGHSAGMKKDANRSRRYRLSMICFRRPGLCYLIVVIVPAIIPLVGKPPVATLIGASSFRSLLPFLAASAAWRCCSLRAEPHAWSAFWRCQVFCAGRGVALRQASPAGAWN